VVIISLAIKEFTVPVLINLITFTPNGKAQNCSSGIFYSIFAIFSAQNFYFVALYENKFVRLILKSMFIICKHFLLKVGGAGQKVIKYAIPNNFFIYSNDGLITKHTVFH
jgi:hypothetical protein